MKSLQELQQNFQEKAGVFEKVVLASLFLIWGVLTQLNDILVPTLYRFGLSFGEAILLHFSFFMTYLAMAFPASKIIDRFGYRFGILAGLGFAGLGCVVFYIGAIQVYFPIFLSAIILIGCGVTILQIAANGYVVLQSSRRFAASNLSFMHALNSFGRTLTILFGFYLLLSIVGLEESSKVASLSPQEYIAFHSNQLQLPYLAMGLVMILVGIGVYFSNLPEFKTAELPVEIDCIQDDSILDLFKIKHLLLGALAIFLYVGAEVSIGTQMLSFMQLPNVMGDLLTEQKGLELLQYYWGGALVGRVIGGFLLRDLSPRRVTAGFAASAMILASVAAFASGEVAVISLVGIGFFNSILFPSIFTLGINGLGHFAEEGASFLIAAVVGGAILPLAMMALARWIGLQLAFLLPALCYGYIIYYGISGSVFRRKSAV